MVIVLLATSAKAQEPCPPDRAPDAPCGDILKFREHGNLRWNDERASLDGLADSFRRSGNQLIYFIIYPGVDSCKDEARLRAERAKKYLVQHHKIPPNDIFWKSGGFRESLSVVIWLLPKGKPLPEPDPFGIIDPPPRVTRQCKGFRVRQLE